MLKLRLVFAPLLTGSLACGVLQSATAMQLAGSAAPKSQPIRSRAELDEYLKLHAGRDSPLDVLPPLARQRFLDHLIFGSNGLGGFDPGELSTELTREEAKQVLTLLGAESYIPGILFRNPDALPSWRTANMTPGRIETGFDALSRLQHRDGDNRNELHARFDREFSGLLGKPAVLSRLSEHDLVYLLRAVQLVSDEMPSPVDADRLREIVAAMERRGLARPMDFREVFLGLVRARQFGQARRYAAAHPRAGLPELPHMKDTGASPMPFSVWTTDHDGTTLTRNTLDLVPLQILVLSGCHFSEDAAEDISADPVLGPVFARNAHWLMLPPGWEEQGAVRDWNRRFPSAQAIQIYDRAEWTLLPPGWSMPTFLIVRDGKVLEITTGSTRDSENKSALVDALKRSGLLAH